jgi:hypothetical protein
MSTSALIAMWSGPRNISTALMRSWENRPDTDVIDEPLYAYYLAHTPYKDQHPDADAIIATYPTDWRVVAAQLTAPPPTGRLYYQKHMAHHLLDDVELTWILGLNNCLLIRDPRQVIASFAKVIPNPQSEQIGLPQQVRLFDFLQQRLGRPPLVIDSSRILANPAAALTQLCAALGVPFNDHLLQQMLHWPAGPRSSDGIWAKHWYAAVEASTTFTPPKPESNAVPAHLTALAHECMALYERLAVHQL